MKTLHRLGLALGSLILLAASTAPAQWAQNGSSIYYNSGNVGIGTAWPGHTLSLGLGNIGLVNANGGNDGNIYLGGISWQGQPGMRLFGGLVNGYLPDGFIDVMTTDPNSGLLMRVDTIGGGTERMRVAANGNVSIGTMASLGRAAAHKLEVGGSHIDTRIALSSSGDGGVNDAHLQLWASEPYATYSGVGISNNIVNYNGSVTPFQRINTQLGGSYIRLLPGSIAINVVSNAGADTPVMAMDASGVTVNGNIAAKYQDVAEWVHARQSIEAGTVVVLDEEENNQVLPSYEAYDTRVAGVISATPGIVLGEPGDGKVKVATTGRVKVKVDASAAPVRVGDLLVTSAKTGVAMKSNPVAVAGVRMHRPGTIIGKALEPLADGQGEILVLLSLQ